MNVSKSQSGFVLMAAIWLTLIMFVLAGVFNAFASNELERAVYSKARLKSYLEEVATEHSLLFLIATRSADRSGLLLEDSGSVIKLDGQSYIGFGSAVFSINDQAGLIGLNAANSYHLNNLLKRFENRRIIRRSLQTALYDYIDVDDNPRLGGRESAAYRVANLEEPTNDYLVTVDELRKVYGWSDWLENQKTFDVQSWLSTNWRSRLNINNAPESLLYHALPLDESITLNLIERRKQRPFLDMSDLTSTLNLQATLDEDYFTFLPSDQFRFRIYSGEHSRILTLSVSSTPMDIRHPWVVNYRYYYERDFDTAESPGSSTGDHFNWKLPAAEKKR